MMHLGVLSYIYKRCALGSKHCHKVRTLCPWALSLPHVRPITISIVSACMNLAIVFLSDVHLHYSHLHDRCNEVIKLELALVVMK